MGNDIILWGNWLEMSCNVSNNTWKNEVSLVFTKSMHFKNTWAKISIIVSKEIYFLHRLDCSAKCATLFFNRKSNESEQQTLFLTAALFGLVFPALEQKNYSQRFLNTFFTRLGLLEVPWLCQGSEDMQTFAFAYVTKWMRYWSPTSPMTRRANCEAKPLTTRKLR